ncbi:MAG: thioredoxin domain-containing protein, partial [Terrimesophilobacter sp.]
FGPAPKFPVVPVLQWLLEHGSRESVGLADRTLVAMANSDLRDRIEGGFFRYATRRDWSEPHYERMLYDNAQLLSAYALLAVKVPEHADLARDTAAGIVNFLVNVLRLPGGGFASAQNSESIVDGYLTEGDYYALDAEGRARQDPPALDEKVLTGWNGLAIGGLAFAGFHLGRPAWVDAARVAADSILSSQMKASGELLRVTLDGKPSAARATLEDYGMLAHGLIHLAQATGEVRRAVEARRLVEMCLVDGEFVVPGGGDPVLVAQGLALATDPTEGAYPSGQSALAAAADRLYLLTGDRRFRAASERAMEQVAPLAVKQQLAFGAALTVMGGLSMPVSQLVVVSNEPDMALAQHARGTFQQGGVVALVTSDQVSEWAVEGFELFDGRATVGGKTTAYLCTDFVCRLPTTDLNELVTSATAAAQNDATR